ncbi:MFS transporter [Paenibacillus sp. HN-1]|uniref:MFS transporter n=1 Tax=Paenibacillus TaxID=44249 RepID=UPI001CA981C0|nr:MULTISPECIES: MFS transporter [Paenibacillus]MBY9078684.1 MFS transporter [Paenibacillus sp. CGMCC 1.18879]MBY9084220.1 MFS transporter [Paenibacillus sinensis]
MRHSHEAARVYTRMKFLTSLAGSTMFTTYTIYYVKELGFTPLQLMLIGTALELTVLIFEGITGVVADTYGRRRSVIIGMFILGGGFTLEGSAVWLSGGSAMLPAFGIILAAQLLFGIGWTFISGADTAWIVDEVGEQEAGGLFMRAQKINLAASLAGIGISVGLSTLMPNLPYLAGGMLYLILGVYLIARMKETGFVPRTEGRGESPLREMRKAWLDGAAVVRRSPLLIAMVVITVFTGAASEGYDRLWEAYMMNGIGFPAGPITPALWFGIFSAAATLFGMAAVHAAERRIDTNSGRTLSISLLLLTAIRALGITGLALSPSFGGAAAAVLTVSIASAVAEPLYATWLNRNLESRTRATVLSMVSQADAFGQSAGGPAVGWIGSRFSIRASLLAAGVLLLPVLGVFSRGIKDAGADALNRKAG